MTDVQYLQDKPKCARWNYLGLKKEIVQRLLLPLSEKSLVVQVSREVIFGKPWASQACIAAATALKFWKTNYAENTCFYTHRYFILLDSL